MKLSEILRGIIGINNINYTTEKPIEISFDFTREYCKRTILLSELIKQVEELEQDNEYWKHHFENLELENNRLRGRAIPIDYFNRIEELQKERDAYKTENEKLKHQREKTLEYWKNQPPKYLHDIPTPKWKVGDKIVTNNGKAIIIDRKYNETYATTRLPIPLEFRWSYIIEIIKKNEELIELSESDIK